MSVSMFRVACGSACVEQAVSEFLGTCHCHDAGRDEAAVRNQVRREVFVDGGRVAADRAGELARRGNASPCRTRRSRRRVS